MSQPSSAVQLTREPVLNKNRAITANRLVVHAPSIKAAVETLAGCTDHWPGRYTVFLSLGRLVPTPDLLEWQIPENAMIEIPAQTLAHPMTQALMKGLREAEVSMCLAWHSPGTTLGEGIDWRFVLTDARKHPAPDSDASLSLAWGLPDPDAFETAIGRGYDGASGWFFLRANSTRKELAPSHGQIVRLMNLVRQNAEIRDIEAVLKQDVALSYKLLRHINSVGFGLMCEIQSFRHAVSILGFNKLHKWLSLLLVTSSRDPSAAALMQTAIARGHFMDLAGKQFFSKADSDNLFITGAFSLLDTLLGSDMPTILEEMHLPAAVSDALLRGEGVYAPFLNLARSVESFDASALARQAEELKIPLGEVNEAMLTALSFADSLDLS
ncbi:MAG: HDOD domain-containing protein [Rhodocyclaceae bacterium]|nr:HDOD domain-containing protein [Rhodocyclaceae bacterium]MCB1901200.1 HDOD domain-containing protein [Rhodocyclaceae bacterium]MCP5308268.1 HDOD domain-containing protein [Zoogloeaceae bacterium]